MKTTLSDISILEKLKSVAEIEVSYTRTHRIRKQVHCSRHAHEVFMKLWDHNLFNIQEQLAALYLNPDGDILGYRVISTGNQLGADADLPLILTIGLKVRASGFILGHNHPSGRKYPSTGDTGFTKRVKRAGKLVGINLLDHLILTENEYFSFGNMWKWMYW